ncbi:MAG: anthranilate phosphoribosyltransferase [Chthoniobacterales bacterium]|jgi:anthranilate phosphoribosyltransferase
MKTLTEWVAGGNVLGVDEVAAAAGALLSGDSGDEEKADFLEALNKRGEQPGEVRAFAAEFLRAAVPFEVPDGAGPVLDVCGTGGDKLGLFNISTAVMFVAAGAGARVVKHGNRGITSRSGGADVLEALGVPVELPPETLTRMLESCGACFLFAPRFHPAFKAVAGARKVLAARGRASIFNMLGPLLNPVRPAFQLTGVFAESLVPLYAAVLPGLGRKRAWVVHGKVEGGVMDEMSTAGRTLVSEVNNGQIIEKELAPGQFFEAPSSLESLQGGDAPVNARILTELLAGETGPRRDILLLNSAAALVVANIAADLPEGVARASEAIDSGAARRVLDKMRQVAAAT